MAVNVRVAPPVRFTLALALVAGGLVALPRAQGGLGLSWPPVNEPGLFHDKRAFDLFTAARIAISGGPNGVARLESLHFKGRSKVPGPTGRYSTARWRSASSCRTSICASIPAPSAAGSPAMQARR